MKLWLIFALGALSGVLAATLPGIATHVSASWKNRAGSAASTRAEALLHTRQNFEFLAKARMEIVAPLLGADAERLWAPDWRPQFVWPAQPADQEGMVFATEHGPGKAVWINTRLDLQGGRFQYAYVIPDTLVTLISITLSPREKGTQVSVQYQRTALNAGANALVQQMAQHDLAAGPHWNQQMNGYLDTLPDDLKRPL